MLLMSLVVLGQVAAIQPLQTNPLKARPLIVYEVAPPGSGLKYKQRLVPYTTKDGDLYYQHTIYLPSTLPEPVITEEFIWSKWRE
jgi:hypothetical protein